MSVLQGPRKTLNGGQFKEVHVFYATNRENPYWQNHTRNAYFARKKCCLAGKTTKLYTGKYVQYFQKIVDRHRNPYENLVGNGFQLFPHLSGLLHKV